MRYDRPPFFFYSQMAPSCTDNLFHVWWSSMELSNLFTKRDLPCGSIGTMNSICHFLISNPCVGLHLFFFWFNKPHFSESVFCGLRWGSKTPAISDSYKKCIPWLELETCCTVLKPFTTTLCLLGTCGGFNNICNWRIIAMVAQSDKYLVP